MHDIDGFAAWSAIVSVAGLIVTLALLWVLSRFKK